MDNYYCNENIDLEKIEILQKKRKQLNISNHLSNITKKLTYSRKYLIKECRKGLSDNIRGYIWQYIFSLDSQGEKNVITTYNVALFSVFGTSMGSTGDLFPSNFGGIADLSIHYLSTSGLRAFSRICLVIQQLYALAYCPILLDLIPILLIYMTEAEAFGCIINVLRIQRRQSEPGDQVLRKIQTSYSADIALVRSFKTALEWRYKHIAKGMENMNAYDDKYFLLLFTKLFMKFLPMPIILRIIDIYIIEGPKILLRILMAIIKICKKEISICLKEGHEWWESLRNQINSDKNNYNLIFHYALRWRYSLLFKRKFIRNHYIRLKLNTEILEQAGIYTQQHPIDIIYDNNPNHSDIHLLHPNRDFFLRSWLPITLQNRRLKLIYNSNHDGSSLDNMYKAMKSTTDSLPTYYHLTKEEPIILLVEILETKAIIGAFLSHPLIVSNDKRKRFSGNGKCFLFKLYPDPERFVSLYNNDDESSIISMTELTAGTPTGVSSILTPAASPSGPRLSRASKQLINNTSRISNGSNGLKDDDGTDTTNNESFEYILCLPELVAIGIDGKTSAAGLRLNEDLTMGSSEETTIFQNPKLAGKNLTEFNISKVELYTFIFAN